MLLSKLVEGIDGKLIADGEFETMNYCTADVEKCFLTFMANLRTRLYEKNLENSLKK